MYHDDSARWLEVTYVLRENGKMTVSDLVGYTKQFGRA